jgi:YbbR domain-containing protein
VRSLIELGKAVLSGLRDALDLARQTATLGLLSLGLAIVVWFIVSDAENPPKTGSFTGMIPIQMVNVPSGKAPASLSETAQVTVKITADQDVWDELVIDDFKATVDLSGMTQAEASLPVLVTALRSDVKVVQVLSPSSVDVTLEPVTTATRPVKINTVAVAPSGFNVVDETVSPETVQVSGAQSLVEQTDAVWVDLNLTGTQVSFDRDFVLNPRDKGGLPVDVHIEPKTAKVSVNIVRTDWVLTFPVNPSITGSVAAGYWTKAVEVDPPFVNVRGPVDVLQSISVITTDTIPVDGAQSDVQRSVKLRLPEGATVDGSNEVVVRVRIEPASGERNFEVAVQTSGLKSGLVANLAAQNVTVTVAGQLPVLDALAADAIVARLDLSNVDAGAYQLAPKIEVPADIQVVGVSPSDIQVTVSRQ